MNSEQIFKLKQEINLLLEERPQYKPFQSMIEEKLKNAGSGHNRLILIHSMMMDKLLTLSALLNKEK